MSEPNDTTETLAVAVEQLYRVFARYLLKAFIDGSPVYADTLPAWNHALAARPLRQLSVDDLLIFYFKAMTTWGDVDDFRHFLPRILDLLTSLDTGWEEWVALDKLRYGQWHTWPAAEQAAVRAYLLALWQYLLTTDHDMADAVFGDYLEAIAHVYPDFSELLRYWEAAPGPHALRRLVHFVEWNARRLLRQKQLSSWADSTETGTQFVQWLTRAELLGKLTATFWQHAETPYGAQVSAVLQLLEEAKKAEA
ncbi:hypothetical protein [Hymenobacter pini]|uniref:hypothetical protein n=1 Tax=Hymenobacter pini TaxID=2880879 RepID=UPI001CF3FC21|nr:hypothetical protein [Hymenobacter pini]MCA8829259.1 hypothetical protein [Hymenobacter pini]